MFVAFINAFDPFCAVPSLHCCSAPCSSSTISLHTTWAFSIDVLICPCGLFSGKYPRHARALSDLFEFCSAGTAMLILSLYNIKKPSFNVKQLVKISKITTICHVSWPFPWLTYTRTYVGIRTESAHDFHCMPSSEFLSGLGLCSCWLNVLDFGKCDWYLSLPRGRWSHYRGTCDKSSSVKKTIALIPICSKISLTEWLISGNCLPACLPLICKPFSSQLVAFWCFVVHNWDCILM